MKYKIIYDEESYGMVAVDEDGNRYNICDLVVKLNIAEDQIKSLQRAVTKSHYGF